MIVQKCGNDLVTWCCSHFVGVILKSWLCVTWITWFALQYLKDKYFSKWAGNIMQLGNFYEC